MPEPPEATQVDAVPAAGEISGAADFDRLVDRYFDDVYFRYQPTEGTAVGLHRHDDRLEDYSREAIRGRIDALRRIRAEFEAIDPKRPPPSRRPTGSWCSATSPARSSCWSGPPLG